MKNTKKILLAISGGPDSMWMLYKFRRANIVVAHINYHKRNDSDIDQKIIENFCKQYFIPYFIHEVNFSQLNNIEGNFQSWARNIRYDFFSKIYLQQNCDVLYTAHHKDDFLESALMQKSAKRHPQIYGIAKKTFLYQMNVQRPFLYKYWKNQIINNLNKNQISYALDSSNEQPIYARNKMRLELKNKNKIWKNLNFYKYLFLNFQKNQTNKKILKEYLTWWKTDFNIKEFRDIKYQKEVIFKFLTTEFKNVKISNNKIVAIIDFINSRDSGKYFKIDNNNKIWKKDHKIILLKSFN